MFCGVGQVHVDPRGDPRRVPDRILHVPCRRCDRRPALHRPARPPPAGPVHPAQDGGDWS
ncbi:hypothetical protein QJS66_02305 [Kocuria rhizophila]|nr:hypothetical protein QJS66_02305 [Kocuria rhizophila]